MYNGGFLYVKHFNNRIVSNRRSMDLEVEDKRPVGRPKKIWRKVLEEDTCKELNIVEDKKLWKGIENSGGNSYYVQPQEWKTRNVKDDEDDDDDDDDDDDEDDDDDDEDDDDDDHDPDDVDDS